MGFTRTENASLAKRDQEPQNVKDMVDMLEFIASFRTREKEKAGQGQSAAAYTAYKYDYYLFGTSDLAHVSKSTYVRDRFEDSAEWRSKLPGVATKCD